MYDNTLNRNFLLEFGNGSDQIPNCLLRIRHRQSNHYDQQKHPEHSTPAPADAIYPTEPAAAPRIPSGWLGIEPTSLVFPLAVMNKITAALIHPPIFGCQQQNRIDYIF
jgi:hypothetical protein